MVTTGLPSDAGPFTTIAVIWFLGIDGGGTHTRALIADANGALLGMGESGSSNYHSVGVAMAVEAVSEAVAMARAEAGVSGSAAGAFLGLAGVKSLADHQALREPLCALNLVEASGSLGLDHDLRIALAGGCGDLPGIVVVAGTGSAAYGCDQEGHTAQTGGWGWLMDDQGGGVWLALQGLRRIFEAADGRAPATHLEPALFAELGVTTPREAMQWALRPERSRSQLAALASTVVATAADDDAAREIVREGAHQLSRLVVALLERLNFGDGDVNVVPFGGLLGNEVYLEAFQQAVARVAPQVRIIVAPSPAIIGAVVLAAQSAGKPLRPEAMERLTSELKKRGRGKS